jgi:hypothetical protein
MCDIHKDRPAVWKVRTETTVTTTKTITNLQSGKVDPLDTQQGF